MWTPRSLRWTPLAPLTSCVDPADNTLEDGESKVFESVSVVVSVRLQHVLVKWPQSRFLRRKRDSANQGAQFCGHVIHFQCVDLRHLRTYNMYGGNPKWIANSAPTTVDYYGTTPTQIDNTLYIYARFWLDYELFLNKTYRSQYSSESVKDMSNSFMPLLYDCISSQWC